MAQLWQLSNPCNGTEETVLMEAFISCTILDDMLVSGPSCWCFYLSVRIILRQREKNIILCILLHDIRSESHLKPAKPLTSKCAQGMNEQQNELCSIIEEILFSKF